jgi:modulator of FtsH protease HflC
MKRFLLLVLLPLVVLGWLGTCCYTVDFTEYAYITRFGQPVGTFDGSTQAGLHIKCPWPIDSVWRMDRRLQSFDLPTTEVLTRDLANQTVDKTLAVDAYVSWRIPDSTAADRFLRSVGTVSDANRILAPQLTGKLAAYVSSSSLEGLLSVAKPEEAEKRAEEFQKQLLTTELKEKVLQEYGIELVTVRVRRLSYPEAVRTSIYERIRSERGLKVAEHENQGRREANAILLKAELERRKIEAEAKAKKQTIEGHADVEADKLRNEAHSKDPEFYAFLQRLKSIQSMLADTRDVLLLSLNHDLFKLLKEPPKEKP